MARDDEKAKRHTVTLRGLFGLVTLAAISAGLFCLPTYPWFSNYDVVGDLRHVGLFSFGGSIGGFCGNVWRGTNLAYIVGFILGGIADYIMLFAYLLLTHGFSPQ